MLRFFQSATVHRFFQMSYIFTNQILIVCLWKFDENGTKGIRNSKWNLRIYITAEQLHVVRIFEPQIRFCYYLTKNEWTLFLVPLQVMFWKIWYLQYAAEYTTIFISVSTVLPYLSLANKCATIAYKTERKIDI